MQVEVEETVENLQMEKSHEMVKIINEMIKYRGEPLLKKIMEICNEVYTKKRCEGLENV